MFLLDILMQNGFKLCRGKHLNYSSMVVDGLDSRYEKDGITFIWELHEKDKPPTLIYPRPKIRKRITISDGKRTVIRNERWDDLMNECVNTFPHEIIVKEAIKRNAIFDLNKKEIIYDNNI